MNSALDTVKNQLSIKELLYDPVVLCVLLGVIIGGSLHYNAEMWLEDYPPEIQQAAGPMSGEARMQRILVGIPFILILVSIPLYSNVKLKRRNKDLSFWTAFINVFLIFNIFNLFDLFVLDVWFVTLTPEAWIISGTAALMEQYNTFSFHVMESVKGALLSFVISPVFAVITTRNWHFWKS
ncbi:MAG: hypothetical protein AYK19_02355 [Theionarchaea archaeon DG-70-1]|nr:MAG: hypothetical protein AYK19_02355 [Theionarchaea archaeon DG-70-1]